MSESNGARLRVPLQWRGAAGQPRGCQLLEASEAGGSRGGRAAVQCFLRNRMGHVYGDYALRHARACSAALRAHASLHTCAGLRAWRQGRLVIEGDISVEK